MKTIRFAVEGRGEYQDRKGGLLDQIEELVKYGFEWQGRPFSAVERMVVSKSERANREQGCV